MSGVAVIGLGRMGAAVCARLAGQGVKVTAWNRTRERAQAAAQDGVELVGSPAAAAADAELVLVSLADGGAQREVLFGPGGVLADAIPGVLACTSTVAPEDVSGLSDRVRAVLDIGLLGSPQHAAEGRLRLYVGGDEDCLSRVRPLLELLAQQILHVGPLGSGMHLKLLMNLLMGVEVQAMAEAVALGCAAGFDRAAILDAITVSGFAAPVMGFKARRLASQNYAEADFRLRLMAKDLALAVQEAGRARLTLPLAEAAWQTHTAGVHLGYGDEDCAAVARIVEREF